MFIFILVLSIFLEFFGQMLGNGFGYDLLRKNSQELFRCSSKIEKRMEFSVENSAAMNYSRCWLK
ncbi:hypothetical protein, partial [Mesonia sp. HuA40]|uniref:hypothetical protein n=1 Tax=Mesonia sp. HuA40 TaxID=2602761 RepID=UPI001C9D2F46